MWYDESKQFKCTTENTWRATERFGYHFNDFKNKFTTSYNYREMSENKIWWYQQFAYFRIYKFKRTGNIRTGSKIFAELSEGSITNAMKFWKKIWLSSGKKSWISLTSVVTGQNIKLGKKRFHHREKDKERIKNFLYCWLSGSGILQVIQIIMRSFWLIRIKLTG